MNKYVVRWYDKVNDVEEWFVVEGDGPGNVIDKIDNDFAFENEYPMATFVNVEEINYSIYDATDAATINMSRNEASKCARTLCKEGTYCPMHTVTQEDIDEL